ncbi:hypothetical protein [Streptomyces sp. NPDC005799]|uniref:hypothetical protein n=1 Tax=Streptomyces sp. NPDC005799 TaxID=3154678 RepID=UPI0033F19665
MDDIAQDPGATSAAKLAEGARPAWELYAAAHNGLTIADLISDLAHLADHLPEQDLDGQATLARAQRDYDEERP